MGALPRESRLRMSVIVTERSGIGGAGGTREKLGVQFEDVGPLRSGTLQRTSYLFRMELFETTLAAGALLDAAPGGTVFLPRPHHHLPPL